MNSDPQDVYSFIHLMSSSERRYFSSRHSKHNPDSEPQFFKLYEFILSAKIYNDEQLRQHPSGGSFHRGKNLSMEKKRLFDQLMAAAVDYDASSSPSIQRKRLLAEAEVLEARGYVSLSKERLQALKEKSMKTGNWSTLMDINILETRIDMTQSATQGPQMITQRLKERQFYLDQLQAEIRLRWAWEMLLILKRQPKEPAKQALMQEIVGLLQEYQDQEALPVVLQLWCHTSEALLALLEGKATAAQVHYKAVMDILQQNSPLIQENPSAAMIHIYNYLNIAHGNRDYSDFLHLIPKIERLEDELNRNGRNQNKYARMLWIIYYANNKALDKAANLAKEQYQENPAPIPGTPISSYLVSLYNSVILLFFTNQFVHALKIIDHVLSNQKYRVCTDLRDALFLLETILLFELGEESRYLAKLNSLRARSIADLATKSYFKLMLRLLNDAYRSQSVNNIREMDWNLYVQEMQLLSTQYPLLQHLGINEITLWILSKSQQVSIADALYSHSQYQFPLSVPNTSEEIDISDDLSDSGS